MGIHETVPTVGLELRLCDCTDVAAGGPQFFAMHGDQTGEQHKQVLEAAGKIKVTVFYYNSQQWSSTESAVFN